MELSERVSILTQAAELAQKAGALTLDDAVYAKQAITAAENGESLKAALTVLTKVAELGQKKGVYTLKDAYYIYLATDNFEASLPVEEPAPEPAKKK